VIVAGVIRSFLSSFLGALFTLVFALFILIKSGIGFFFDSNAVVQVAREVHLYQDLGGLFASVLFKSHNAAEEVSIDEKHAEGLWKQNLNKALHEAISETFFYDVARKWHQGFLAMISGGEDAAQADFSGFNPKIRTHVERFAADFRTQSINLPPESLSQIAGWQKSLNDATDRIPDQCTLSQIINASGGDSRKTQESLEPVRRNIKRLQFFEKALLWAALVLLGIMALVLAGSLRRICLVLGLMLFGAGFACLSAADRIGEFFLQKAKEEALTMAQGVPAHAKERVLEVTGTVLKHALHHADQWVYGSLVAGGVLLTVVLLCSSFFSRRPGHKE
jgi:hypothetical protein